MSERPAATQGLDVPGLDVPTRIVCVDCGGTCHLLSVPEPDFGFQPGDVAAYRCADCGDRWDVVVAEAEDHD